jgi:nucleoside-diphosphate-sugar epimerase
MKKILILGGGGYVGTQLSEILLKDYNVTVYDIFYFNWLLRNKKKLKNCKRLTIKKKNVLDVVDKDLKNIDIVCDLVGIANDPSSDLNKDYSKTINCDARYNFAKIAKKNGVKRYIFNSTCSVYGFNKNKVFEKSKTNPLSCYAKAVYKAEKKIYSLKSNKFKVNILRNSTLYGFSNTMRFDLVINLFTYFLLNNKEITINGDGRQSRPFLSVMDVSRIYDYIIKKNPSSFIVNVVAFNNNIRSLSKKIIKLLDKPNDLVKFDYANNDHRNYNVGSKNFKKFFKNFKFTPLQDDLKKMTKKIKSQKLKLNTNSVRVKFYKKILKAL